MYIFSKPNEAIIVEKEPILGLLSLSDSIIQGLTGEIANDRFLIIQFQYAKDGVNFSDWEELNNSNLQALTFQTYDVVVFRFSFIRSGNNLTGTISFTDIALNGTYIPIKTGDNYKKSLFNKYFRNYNINTLSWTVNVLQKIYHPGLIPKYLERGRNNNENGEDNNFLSFWFTVIHFFSFFVQYARTFESFRSYNELITEYLRQKGLFLSNDESLADLEYLMKNFYNEISDRGTIRIIKEKGKEGALINGELLRIFSFKNTDEFLFGFTPLNKFGWSLGNASPLSRKINKFPRVIKGYEKTKDFVDLNKYPLLGSPTIEQKNGLNYLKCTTNQGISINEDINKYLYINPKIDYEISFYAMVDNNTTRLTFEAMTQDIIGNNISLRNPHTNTNSNTLLNSFEFPKINTLYRIVGVIYNQDQGILTNENAKLNIGFGTKLRLKPKANKLGPVIFNSGSGNLFLYDLKIKPLRTKSSTGFIQANHLIQLWAKNNNTKYSINNIEEIIREYLIPYNSWLKIHNLDAGVDTQINLPPLPQPQQKAWRAKDVICETVRQFEETFAIEFK